MMELERLTSKKLEKLDRSLVMIIPTGATEAHDEFLPLNTDNLIAQKIAKEVAEKSGNICGVPITKGSSESTLTEQGTIGIMPDTLQKSVEEICKIYIDYGFKKIFLLNGHGKNTKPMQAAIEKLKADNSDLHIETLGWWKFGSKKVPHTGKEETEMALAVDPSIGEPSDSPNNPDIEEGKRYYNKVVESIVSWLKEKW
ncbi:creatininase family protein [Candidatus Woesearchaeota archaeon]|nr:creatininase family protein [Candidatus Woesearchaeota archaeon]